MPSHAAQAMELGFDAVLINTAVAQARDPVAMAGAFAQAVEAGRAAYLAGPMEPRDLAVPSTPVIGKAFLRMRLRARLSDRGQRRLDRATAAGRRAVGATADQGSVGRGAASRDPRVQGLCRRRRAAGRQRLLAARDGGGLRLRAPRVRGISTPPTCRHCAARNVRIGISTHDESELERALALDRLHRARAIYPTLLKVMPWAPQGLARISEWKRRIGAIPLVAIGGHHPGALPGVFAAGADFAAVVTDIVRNRAPEERRRVAVARCGAPDVAA